MKKSLILISALLCFKLSFAGLITHTDYTAGSVVTSAGQNANENTIVNEFNGNIDNTNIKTGGITSTNILDGTIVEADLAALSQSSKYASYRRPILNYINTTNVDVENNTATANQTCIIFTDGTRRCVTENTGSTTQYRRLTTSASAVFTSGTEDSGMSPGETVANNTWYAIYGVKSQINASNFVLAATTNSYTQGNMSRLDTLFGINGWVYLGLIRYGDNGGSNNVVIQFTMSGNRTQFVTGELGGIPMGIGLSSRAVAVADLTYTYTVGTSSVALPASIGLANIAAYVGTTSGATTVNKLVTPNNGNSISLCGMTEIQNQAAMCSFFIDPSMGVTLPHNSTDSLYIILMGFIDNALAGSQTGY